jgi:GNAT superfamily N-acetyltransferase
MSEEFTLRKATFEDAETISGQRRALFEDMGITVPDEAITAFVDWVRPKLSKDEYLGWFVIRADGEVVAGAGLWLFEWPPTPRDIATLRAYVLNVFVEANYRHQGLARRLMDAVLAYWPDGCCACLLRGTAYSCDRAPCQQ